MRDWLVVIALAAVCGCGNKSDSKPTAKTAKTALEVPKVGSASMLAADDGKPPPLLVLIDDAGAIKLSWAATWQDLSTVDLKARAKTTDLVFVGRLVREVHALGQEAEHVIKNLDTYRDLDQARLGAMDDPPPPEEEDVPDEGEDESGGTGTAMALDEGKMGKRDADRAEGQYKMQKNPTDPAEAAARQTMGQRGMVRAYDTKPDDTGNPSRLSEVVGEVTAGKLPELPAVILASPRAKAAKLIEAIAATEGAIAVSHEGTVRPLRLSFGFDRDNVWDDPPWLEARLSTKGIAVEAVPEAVIDVAWASGPVDIAALKTALDNARATRKLEPLAPVDVLVDADVDAQRLIDLLVALDGAGVRMIGLGKAPDAEQLKRRGHRNPTVSLGQPNAQGDLDKAEIRKVIKANRDKFRACYTAALAKQNDLAGTVSTQFFIRPNGKVASASAAGVEPHLADCVTGVIKSLEFPKPKGGGGVQVNYPFRMSP